MAATLDRARGIDVPIVDAASLLDFIPALTPSFAAPTHLFELCQLLERAPRGKLRVVISIPPRHAKTETILAAIAWWLSRDPSTKAMYCSYGARLAYSKSTRARRLAIAAGVKLRDDTRAKSEWMTEQDGGLVATGIGGDLTGRGAGVLVVDDPVKNRLEAESQVIRDRTWAWFTSTALTRLEPDGSVIIVQTRWHEDDLAGRAIEQGYEYICLPAIDEKGTALWPERFSAERLAEVREEVGDYDWWSLYQQDPRPRGTQLFTDVVTCLLNDIPSVGRVGIGVDLTRSGKKRSDPNAAVVIRRASDGFYYVCDVRHAPGALSSERRGDNVIERGFTLEIRDVQSIHRGAPTMQFIGGIEDAIVTLLGRLAEEDRVYIQTRQASADKWIRAQRFAAAWRAGLVRVPSDAEWFEDFLRELKNFTGAKGGLDNRVDAAAAAFELVWEGDRLDVLTASSPSAPASYREPAAERIGRRRNRGISVL